ncbi:MAG: DNA polymerase III subunit beta [bacterium]|nr:DNA polymerase III subunit beta [bacterium]
MKAELIREQFLKATGPLVGLISTRPTLPVLNNLLLSTEGGQMEITATNLETFMQNKTAVRVLEKGRVTVPARVLIDFIQALSSDRIQLSVEKEILTVNASEASASIPTISAAEFPSVGEFNSENQTLVDKKKLLEAIHQVSFSAAPEESRPVLTGILFAPLGGQLSLVATDGYRLAKKDTTIRSNLEAIVPARALRETVKALTEQEDDQVEISTNKENNQVRLQTRNLTVFSRLLEGTYPDYEQILPTDFTSEAVVATKKLVDAVKLASLFARDVGSVVRFDVGAGKIKISASTTSVGEAETAINTKQKGEELKIAFNSRFLLEALATIAGDQTHLSFSGPTSAALLREETDSSLLHVVMPVRAAG